MDLRQLAVIACSSRPRFDGNGVGARFAPTLRTYANGEITSLTLRAPRLWPSGAASLARPLASGQKPLREGQPPDRISQRLGSRPSAWREISRMLLDTCDCAGSRIAEVGFLGLVTNYAQMRKKQSDEQERRLFT